MHRTYLRREFVPFLAMFAALLLATAVVDAVLHRLALGWVGRYLAIPGTLLILLSFLYSLRKRKRIRFGTPKRLLALHETLAWVGVLMILVHAGIHVYALLPWLAVVAMLINVISGMVGKYLLDRARRFLSAKKDAHASQGMAAEAVEQAVFWDAVAVDVMKQWRAVHVPITLAFVVLSLVHVVSIVIFGRWN